MCVFSCLSGFCLCLWFPAHESHVSTRHFASLLSYCHVQRHCTLALSVASRILQSVPGLADQTFAICHPHCVALCALTSRRHSTAHSSPVQARNAPAALYPNSTTPQPYTSNPSLRQTPSLIYCTSFLHSPVQQNFELLLGPPLS